MEKKLVNIKDLNIGDQVLLYSSLYNKDIVCGVTHKEMIDKYDLDGKRSLGRDSTTKKITFISAEEEGCKPNEKILEVELISVLPGVYTFNETHNLNSLNIRIIDKRHEMYDKQLVKHIKSVYLTHKVASYLFK